MSILKQNYNRRIAKHIIDKNMEKCQELLHQVQNSYPALFDLIATTDLDQIISSATLLEELKPPPQNQYYYRRYIDIAKAKPVDRV